jgi:protocatechuate 3,4-dioxygenase beta subunit
VSTCIEGRLHTENISSPLSEVRGRVVTADGQPVAGARLRNVVPGYEDKYCPETVTDSSGGYNFASLNPQPYRVTLLSPGDGQTHVDFTVTEYGHRYVVEFIVGDCGN